MNRTRLWLIYLKLSLAVPFLLGLWWLLVTLLLRVPAVHGSDYQNQIGPDVEAQLAFIRARLHDPNGDAFRQPIPVWVVFAHTFYGFSLVNTVLLDLGNEARRVEAIHELEWILDRLDHPAARQGFIRTQVPYGVFYLGERNLILAGLNLIDPESALAYQQEFHRNSRILYKAFMASPAAHLETWPGAAWPADNVPALYSLVIHDRLYGTSYGEAAERWVKVMEATLDPETGLMTSRIDYETGTPLDLPRGCALSFTFAFLPDFAPNFAASQYTAYRQQFFKSTLGFAGIREYPPGRGRAADIDSGPIFLEVGAAATGIGLAATKAMGDLTTFESLVRLSEIIGLPRSEQGQKSYLFGRLLIGDEIQVWGKTITPWSLQPPPAATPWPRLKSISLAYFYSLALIAGLFLAWLSLFLTRSFWHFPYNQNRQKPGQ